MMVRFESALWILCPRFIKKENAVRVGPPLTKLSGCACSVCAVSSIEFMGVLFGSCKCSF